MIQKFNLKVQFESTINRYDSQVRSKKCNSEVQLSCESEVCDFAKFMSLKACTQKTQQNSKNHFHELRQFDNEYSTNNWCPGLNEP